MSILVVLTIIVAVYELLILLMPEKIKEWAKDEELMTEIRKKMRTTRKKKNPSKDEVIANGIAGYLIVRRMLPLIIMNLIYLIYLIILLFIAPVRLYGLAILVLGFITGKLPKKIQKSIWTKRIDAVLTIAVLFRIYYILIGA